MARSLQGGPHGAMRVAFTAAVGSHLDTAHQVEGALREGMGDIGVTVVDLIGFSPWDAHHVPYAGDAARVAFKLQDCGLQNARIDSSTWPRVRDGAAKLLGQIEPDLLITMDDSWYDQHALISAAIDAGVPTVMVQEGPFTDGIAPAPVGRRWPIFRWSAIRDSDLVHRLRRRPSPLHLPTYGRGGSTELMAVSGSYKQRFIASGVSPEKIHVVGVPRYDALPRLRAVHDQRLSNASPDDPPRILVLSQPFVRYNEITEVEYDVLATIARESLLVVAERTGALVDVRMHPSDREEDMEALVARGLPMRLVPASEPLVTTLPAYDVVVGFASSGLLEALGVGLPVVVIESPPIAFRTVFFREAGVPVATDVDNAVRFIHAAVMSKAPPDPSPRVADETGVLDGLASRRVAERCRRLLNERRGTYQSLRSAGEC
jgi:hypothetical protein